MTSACVLYRCTGHVTRYSVSLQNVYTCYVISPQLTVECQKKKRAPRVISRGSATTDGQFAYFTTQGSRSVYRYEFQREKWDKELPQCPYRYSTLVIIDEELTTVGGRGESGCTKKLFTLRQDEWVEHYPPMNNARSQPAIVSTSDGNYIFVIGGSVDNWTVTVELFHARSRWYILTKLPEALTTPSATICDNQIYVIGGKDNGYSCSLRALLSGYQPITSESISWQPLPCLPLILSTVATFHGHLGDHLLIIGGDRSEDQSRISKLFVDPDVNTIHQLVDQQWVKIGVMSVTRSECLVVNLPEKKELLIVGGVDERGVDICFVRKK